MDCLATEAEADREYANNLGYDNQDRAWILSDRDVWYANPYYSGPPVPHPEDDSQYENDYDATVYPEWNRPVVTVCDELPF